MNKYDAVLIPGGGVREEGELPLWSERRFNKVLEMDSFDFIIPLSAGTTHKPPLLDANGYPIFEAFAGAKYLVENGVNPDCILPEICSYDTIGNAFFSRVIHVDPLKLRKLLIITSEFHMPRTKAIFLWVYSLEKRALDYQLSFVSVSDEGIDTLVISARREKEKESLRKLKGIMDRIKTLEDLHRWLYTEHAAYSVSHSDVANLTTEALKSY